MAVLPTRTARTLLVVLGSGLSMAGAITCVSLDGLTSNDGVDAGRDAVAHSSTDATGASDASDATTTDAARDAAADATRGDTGLPPVSHFVQCADSNGALDACNSGASVTLAQPVAKADLLLLAVYYFLPADAGASSPTMTITDTLGSTFVELDDLRVPGDGKGLRTFSALVTNGGPSDQISIAFSPCVPTAAVPYAAEYTGLAEVVAHHSAYELIAPTSVDGVVIVMATDAGGTTLWALSASNSGESSFTSGGGFTAREAEGGTFPGKSSSLRFGQAEDRPAPAQQVLTATWTIDPVSDMYNTIVLLR